MADDLKGMLKKVLASKGEKKFYFAYGTGKRKDGKGEGELAVRAKKPKKAEVEGELTDCKEVFEGFCWSGSGPENGETCYFQAKGKKLALPLVKKMMLTAKHEAGKQYDFQLPSPEEEARADELATAETEAEEEGAALPSAPPQPQQSNAAALKFVAKLKALAPVLQKAEALGTEPVKAAQARIAEGNKLYAAADYDSAIAALDQAEALLKQALAGAVKPSATSPTPPDAARFAARLKSLAPVMQKAVATGSDAANAAKTQIGEANKLYVGKQYEQANIALDKAELLLKQALSSPGPKAPQPKGTQVAFTQARLRWDTARKTVHAELAKLEQAIISIFGRSDKIPRPKLTELATASKKLYTILDKLDERLIDKLDEALNASTPEARGNFNQQAAAIVKEYQAFVYSDPLVNDLDGNPFTPVNVRGYLVQTLAELETRLA